MDLTSHLPWYATCEATMEFFLPPRVSRTRQMTPPPLRSPSPSQYARGRAAVPQSNLAELNPVFLLPPICPEGVVYLHPCPLSPPTSHPPFPPPPAPRPVVYYQAPLPVPVFHAAPASPAAPVPPDPEPWLVGLLQGPHQAAAAALLQRYLALLEYKVDNYM